MTESQPIVSVLLPTYNRAALCREALESLFNQTLDAKLFEVIVVDNNSADNTEDVVREIARQAPFRILYRRMDRNYGAFASLNLCCELARCEILAALDSEAWAHPEWLERGLAAFGEGDEIAFVSGHIADKPGQRVTFFSLRNGAPSGENLFYPSGNCFYRKSVLREFGGFDETLGFGDVGASPVGCADSDLAWRIREAGRRYAYRPDVIVYHEVVAVKPLRWLRAHFRLMALPVLIRLHPGLRQLLIARLFFLPDNICFYAALAGMLLAAPATPWALLLAAPYLLRAATGHGGRPSLRGLLRMPARILFLSLRQGVICSSLVYGSMKARRLVL